MYDNTVSLSNTSVGGKITGRDDNSFNISTSYERSVYLQDLYEKFQKEKESNPELREFCEELDYFNSIIDEDIIGLDEKLRISGRENLIHYAKELKEKFHKKLMKYSQYSLIAQDVNVYLLTKVRRGFMMEVYTLICNNAPEERINMLIAERIINPVKVDLGINLFRYTEEDIMGMIFFLTGNCHIKWT